MPTREPIPPVIILIAWLLIAWGSGLLLRWLAIGIDLAFPSADTPSLASHFQGVMLFLNPINIAITFGQVLVGIALLRRVRWGRTGAALVLFAMMAVALYSCTRSLLAIPERLQKSAALATHPEIAAWQAKHKVVDDWNAMISQEGYLHLDDMDLSLKNFPPPPDIVVERFWDIQPAREIVLQQVLEFLGGCAHPLSYAILLALLLQPAHPRWRWLSIPHLPAVTAGIVTCVASFEWDVLMTAIGGLRYRLEYEKLVDRSLYVPFPLLDDHSLRGITIVLPIVGLIAIIAFVWRPARRTTWLLKAVIAGVGAIALFPILNTTLQIKADLAIRTRILRTQELIQEYSQEPIPEKIAKSFLETPNTQDIYRENIMQSISCIPGAFLYLMLFRLLPWPAKPATPENEQATEESGLSPPE